MTRILFLIQNLDRAGAQRQLVELASRLDRDRFRVAVVTFYDGGGFRGELEGRGAVEVVSLGKRGRWDLAGPWVRLRRFMRRWRPDVVHGYLPAGNIAALITAPRGARVVWAVRASNMDLSRYDWFSRLLFRVECRLSRRADLIIANSRAGQLYHVQHGFPEERMSVVPNGIDTDRFRPCPADRARVRREWEVGARERLIGLVARVDPMKGHETFLAAAAALAGERADVRFVCVGDASEADLARLSASDAARALGARLRWEPARADIPAVMNALDVATSPSLSEGFSNTVVEAMACGTPCVVTDVGDSARIVGDAGEVVPAGDPGALADGCVRMLARLERDEAGTRRSARDRAARFGVGRMVEETTTLLEGLVR